MPCGRWESDLTLRKWGGGEGGSPKDERCRDEKVRGVCMVWRASGNGTWESGERESETERSAASGTDRPASTACVWLIYLKGSVTKLANKFGRRAPAAGPHMRRHAPRVPPPSPAPPPRWPASSSCVAPGLDALTRRSLVRSSKSKDLSYSCKLYTYSGVQ